MTVSLASVWPALSWDPGLPCKKSGYLEAARLETPCRKATQRDAG